MNATRGGSQPLRFGHDRDDDGWTYGASTTVPSWIDAEGSWHDSSWPACLDTVAESKVVRFESSEVSVDGTATRLIVAIDCRVGG